MRILSDLKLFLIDNVKNFLKEWIFLICCFELAFAQCVVGMNIIIGKVISRDFPIFILLTLRFAVSFLILLSILALKRQPIRSVYKNFMLLPPKDKLLLILQAGCGGFLFNVLILYGMKTTNVISAGIISSITPVMTLGFAVILLREKITFQKAIAMFIVMLGLVILDLSKKTDDSYDVSLLGNLLVFLAVIPEALFTVFSKFISNKINQIEAVILINFFNLLLFVPFAISCSKYLFPISITFSTYGLIFLYSISGGVLFFLLWYQGLTKINITTAALFTGVVPICTTILSFLFLNERILVSEIVGIILIIIAVFIGSTKNSSGAIA